MEFKKFTMPVKVNDQYLEVTVSIEVFEDDYTPKAGDDFDFGNDKENVEYEKRFKPNHGDLFNAVIRVQASAFGVTGQDTLGGCHIHCNNAFNSDPFNKDVQETIEQHDMVTNAVTDLVTQLKQLAKKLAPFNG